FSGGLPTHQLHECHPDENQDLSTHNSQLYLQKKGVTLNKNYAYPIRLLSHPKIGLPHQL
ncbi:hypothetical protein AB4549_17775, partial [Vibrio breoganii]